MAWQGLGSAYGRRLLAHLGVEAERIGAPGMACAGAEAGSEVAVVDCNGGGGPGKNSGPFCPQPTSEAVNNVTATIFARPCDLPDTARRPKIWP